MREYQATNQAAAQPDSGVRGAPVARVKTSSRAASGTPSRRGQVNPIERKNVDVDTVEGKNRILDVTFKGDPKRKGGGSTRPYPASDPDAIGDATTFTYYVRNLGDRPVRMTVGVKTGDWVFHESAMQTVAAKTEKWTQISLRPRRQHLQERSHLLGRRGTVANLDQIKEIQILISHEARHEGHLQLDPMQFVAPATR